MGMIGIISAIVKNLRTGESITDFGTAIDETAKERCCGVNCCDGYVELPNHGGTGTMVGYFKNGTWTSATKAAFEADKANGFV